MRIHAPSESMGLHDSEGMAGWQLPFSWVVADSVYGDGKIETALRRAGKGYVLRVSASHMLHSWAKPEIVAGTAKNELGLDHNESRS